jgi:predicted CoA-substrate-specific enzyme activase
VERLVGRGGSFYVPHRLQSDPHFHQPPEPFFISRYRRIRGRPSQVAYELLKEVLECIPNEAVKGIRVCGSGSQLISRLIPVSLENEFKALAKGFEFLYPEVKTVVEMGGTSSKYLLLERDAVSGDMGIVDYERSGDCAAGTGSFLDQQASRLRYRIEEVGQVVMTAEKTAKIAGRCSVFAKSDMIHAQQKGYQPAEVLKGLCEAVARNYKGSITKGKTIQPPVAFIGGVAANAGVVQALTTVFRLPEEDLFVPVYYAWMAALGAAYIERRSVSPTRLSNMEQLSREHATVNTTFPVHEPLTLDNVILLRDHIKPYRLSKNGKKIPVYLGIDVGSVSTNLAVIDEQGRVLKGIYLKTDGRPIEVVNTGLREIEEELGNRIHIRGVATTGSGRELIGELIGADTINDEITAHKAGADFIGRTYLNKQVDTIFEVGGQDSKFISLENGVVVDFAMNEACAAGTGSFLEERAEELEVNIIGEFARLALESKHPIRLGERCTVFMERDVSAYQQRGADKKDLIAGLAYSVAYNYLNRVVKGRKIGDVIFFQGGTAYNDAVAAAFSRILGREIIVPPHNGILGAIGAALLAREKMHHFQTPSTFRGYHLEQIDYQLREFVCKACSNYCNMQEFTVEGEKTYWGDQCSDKFRKRRKIEKTAVIPDLIQLRQELLLADYDPQRTGRYTIGIPRAMYTYEFFPFWNALFTALDCAVLLSTETNRRVINAGLEAVVAEPCFPIKVAHGHIQELLTLPVDYIFLPNIVDRETRFMEVNSHLCPWGQTLPFVVAQTPALAAAHDRLIVPTIYFRRGFKVVLDGLVTALGQLGFSRRQIRRALERGYAAQRHYKRRILELGREALRTLAERGEPGIILVGRAYNLYDKGASLDIAGKIRDYYGVNVIPMDFLDLEGIDIRDVNDNMFWNYGRLIIAAARFAGKHEHLHLIYITNFKCGPDSYIKHFITAASGKPYLSLQFDGHRNDAGFITRCEAYLDSKRILKWWDGSEPQTQEVAYAGS